MSVAPMEGGARSDDVARRASLALLEAIIPGSPGGLLPADEDTLRRSEALVAELSPALVAVWKRAQQVLSVAAVMSAGRPFHMLSAEAQQATLVKWQGNPVLRGPLALVAILYKLVHFDTPAVYARMGGRLNVVQTMEQPRWLRQVTPAMELPPEETLGCDVVVVGTGAGGAVVGRELADRGHAVLFVEEGEHYRRSDFDGGSVRAHQRFYRGGISIGNALIPVFMGRLVGGSTAINGGTCFRTPPWVLDRWCDELRTDEFSPGQMAPWFDRVESVLEVGFTDPRYIGPFGDVVSRGCNALGWSHGRIRRNAPGCVGSGFCDFGCRTDARRSTNLSYIPPALNNGAQLITGMAVDHVRMAGGRAVGVEGTARDGRRIRVHARAVILAGGTIPTPVLLQRQGIANRSGQVGRNLTLHPSSGLAALFPQQIRGADHVPQAMVVDQFIRDGMLILGALPDRNIAAVTMPVNGRQLMDAMDSLDHIAGIGTLVADATANGRVRPGPGGHPAITYNLQPLDLKRLHQAQVHAAEMFLAAGATRLYPVLLSHPVLEPGDIARFREMQPSAGETAVLSYHPLGTCKMGVDPRTSVVGLDHQSHDVPGLFIVDGSTIQGPLGVNPQLTIMAVATRAASRIADVLG